MPNEAGSRTQSRAAFVDQRLITLLMRAFGKHAGTDKMIDASDLQKALGLQSEYLARRVLARFDHDEDGVVSRDDFLEGVQRLVLGSDLDKLRFAFAIHDHDEDGSIDEGELVRMIALSLAESDVRWRGEQTPESLARTMMNDADTNRDGRLSFAEFERVVMRHPHILAKMTRSEALWISPSEDMLARLDPKTPPTTLTRISRWLANHWREASFFGLWLVANFALFFAFAFGTANIFIGLGQATGHCLSFNAALVVLLALRRFLTKVRASALGNLVPVDAAIDFHALIGHTMFGLAIAHTLTFLAAYVSGHEPASLLSLLTTTRRGITGAVLVIAFIVMWAFSLERVRRSQRFELFYFTHLLYIVWLAGAAIHEPRFLLFAGIPMIALLIEHVMRAQRRGYATVAHQALALRSGVTELVVERPPGFHFEAGDYAFLRIPKVAAREWHPFTISSAPEGADLTFHIRSLGNWTSALRKHVEASEKEAQAKPFVVHVDGPYGSPTAHLFDARFAVLIGAGIGVTPFASVLASLVARHGTERAAPLVKGHFYWVNRDQYSFEWFNELLHGVELKDITKLFDLHLHMTGGRTGVLSTALETSREIAHDQGQQDVVTGLRAYTHFGPPEWKLELERIRDAHRGHPVDVFFCGPPGLGTKIAKLCRELGLRYHEERF